MGSIGDGSPFRALAVVAAVGVVAGAYLRLAPLFQPFGRLRWLDAPDEWMVAIGRGILGHRPFLLFVACAGWLLQLLLAFRTLL
jgi:hypothetical protein